MVPAETQQGLARFPIAAGSDMDVGGNFVIWYNLFEMPKIYKVMFYVSLAVMAVSLALFLIFGLNFGIDFTGGAILEIEFLGERPPISEIRAELNKLNLGQIVVSSSGQAGVIIKMPEISEGQHQQILSEFEKFDQFEEKRFDSIGSTLGTELKRKSIIAIAIALILISGYLAIMFSRMSNIVSPLILALGAIVALIHDLILPVGVFVLLGKLKGVALDAPIIAAALAILGYSINDTVVVYDRIRENFLKNQRENFSAIIHKSIKQVLIRSINTTLTTLFAVIAIYIFGGETLKNFSLALIIGIAAGAYSSIFIASPILMMLHKK